MEVLILKVKFNTTQRRDYKTVQSFNIPVVSALWII